MELKKTTLSLLAFALSWPCLAQAQHPISQYAEHQGREIKALSAEEVEALLQGDGMGMALPAELNGYPGPRHALELADRLELSGEQAAATQRIYDSMKRQAIEIGGRIVELERRLDGAFAHRTIDREQLDRLTGEVARLRGQLRAVHLGAHLELAAVLSTSQRATYARLRGYSEQHH